MFNSIEFQYKVFFLLYYMYYWVASTLGEKRKMGEQVIYKEFIQHKIHGQCGNSNISF